MTLSKATRLAEVVALAGGPHAEADLENVSISNPHGKAQYVNLYRVLFEGDQAQNVYVQPGDVVFVPSLARSSQKVYAFGELSRVGAFPLRQGMSVLDLVSEAGGYSREAVLGNVGILRTNLERPEVLTVDLNRLIKKGDLSQNVILQNRDIVYVPRHKVYSINQWVTAYTDLVRAGLVPLQLYRQVNDLAKK